MLRYTVGLTSLYSTLGYRGHAQVGVTSLYTTLGYHGHAQVGLTSLYTTLGYRGHAQVGLTSLYTTLGCCGHAQIGLTSLCNTTVGLFKPRSPHYKYRTLVLRCEYDVVVWNSPSDTLSREMV